MEKCLLLIGKVLLHTFHYLTSIYTKNVIHCILWSLQSIHGHFPHTVDNICWLAPEVLAQDTSGYSYKSDTYSVGIAALELSTGEAPFAGLPVTEVRGRG